MQVVDQRDIGVVQLLESTAWGRILSEFGPSMRARLKKYRPLREDATLFEIVDYATEVGATLLAQKYYKLHWASLGIVIKADDDETPSTTLDKMVEAHMMGIIFERCPSVVVTAEEGGRKVRVGSKNASIEIFMDACDGTLSRMVGLPFAVIGNTIAIDGELVYTAIGNPHEDALIFAEAGKGAFVRLLWGEREQARPIHVSRDKEWPLRTWLQDGLYNEQSAEPGLSFKTKMVRLGYKNQRECGSTIFAAAAVAQGRAEGGIVHAVGGTWDWAPIAVLIPEAGGRVSVGRTVPSRDPDVVVFTNGENHDRIVEIQRVCYGRYPGFRRMAPEP